MNSPFLQLNKARGIILDWDGVIAETSLDFGPIRCRFFGGRRAPLLEEAAKMAEPQKSEFMKAIEDEEMRGAALSTEVEGARRLTEYLDAHAIPWCVLSRNCLASIELAARLIGFQLPSNTFAREAPHVKPDPRAMSDAANALGVPEESCLVVGDFLYELLGARRAGMRCALVQRDGDWKTLADAVYPKMADFTAAFERGDSLIPWEYHHIAEERGLEWPKKAWNVTVQVDAPLDAASWNRLHQFAEAGVGSLAVLPEREVTEQELRLCQGLSPFWLGMPLRDALAGHLKTRYPLLNILTGGGGLPLSSDEPPLQALERAMR